MKAFVKLLVLYFCLFWQPSAAQNQKKIDSLKTVLKTQPDSLKITTYGELIKILTPTDRALAKGYLNDEIALAKKLQNHNLQARAKLDEGNYFSLNAEYDNALSSYEKAKEFYLKDMDTLSTAKVYNNMFMPLFYKGESEKALESVMNSLKINEKFGAPDIDIYGNYMAIGNMMSTLDRFELSLDYYKKAEAIARKQPDSFYLARARHNIGLNLEWLKRHHEAIPYFTRNIAFFKKTEDNFRLANTLNSLGLVYFEMDKLSESKPYFEQAYALNKRMGNEEDLAISARNLGRVLIHENKPREALKYIKQGMQYSIQSNTKFSLLTDYENFYNAYEAMGDYKNAYKYAIKRQQLYDSVYNKENAEKLNELELKYQTEKKEAQLALQEQEIKTFGEKAKVDRLTKGLYAGGMFTFVAFSGLLFFGFRQRMKKKRIEHEKQQEIYKQEIEFKKKELASQTLHLVQKNTFLQELKENLENLRNSPEKFKMEFRRIVMLLKKENASDKDWEVFKSYFSEVHDNFDNKLRNIYNDISEKELRLASFIKMNLSTKEIAAMLNVMPESVFKSKYRLKQKLNLDKDTDLYSFLTGL